MNPRYICVFAVVGLALSAGVAAAEEASPAPLGLEEALDLARGGLEDFELAREAIVRARAARDRAWVPILPTLVASGTLTHSDRAIEFGDRVLQRQDAFAGGLSASVTILDGPAIPRIGMASRESAAVEAETLWAQGGLLFEVARAYYAVAAADNLVAAAERTRQTAEEHVQAVQARRAAGEALGVDERRARAEVVSAEETLVRAGAAREGAGDYLAFLIGREPPVEVTPPSAPPLPEAAEGGRVDDDALEDRLDLRAAALSARAAEAGVTESWLEYLPTVELTGTYRASQNTGFSGDPDSWQVLLSLDWILFDGGLRRAGRIEAASRLREARLRLRRLDRGARREARQALRDVDTASATLRTSRELLELARETRSMVLRRYGAGLSSSIELLDADEEARQADYRVVATELDLALSRLGVLRTLGLDPFGRSLEAE